MKIRPISSSNRSHRLPDGACEAVLANRDAVAGPVRLPLSRASDFVDQFNRIYGRLGLNLAMTPAADAADAADAAAATQVLLEKLWEQSADGSADVSEKP
ncbi:hypothetical protein K227x_27900 [Rubripirellula lacrimiformis]|uniref:Uncharacterized protein n=1 Tax=Rubripirellula lacrimiformis TaxID=1930273 RepID=A0A517NB88_9BACT|nr:hypothetical protein [Rubripirellula lacrimiformis]QDT04399.1 hypothetical protein K227x_27900 [Rubripirellula lacrimiformis]